MTSGAVIDLLGLVRSRPVVICGRLGHQYLKNIFLVLSEPAAAAKIRKRSEIIAEITAMLREIEQTFIEGYNPDAFVLGLRSLEDLDDGLRGRLLLAVQREYTSRFRPDERLCDLQQRGRAFLEALRVWLQQVTASGVGAESAPLWNGLRGRAAALREFLEDWELSTRWIP